MAISKKQQLKVLLLLAGYLFVVLNHIYFVKPEKYSFAKFGLKINRITPKNNDKPGSDVTGLKKIYKTTVNRNASNLIAKALHKLYVAELLFDASAVVTGNSELKPSTIPVYNLPVKRSYHLRI
ncbi:hypothetical protein [Mucilaginibacter auburnensis]|uniref:Uncharacterized protein n=1 Tax=Mucilaginibacter auburnensis TaxID=1457233 RepID=A0A2H9VPP8_9SPHI|nr:hypothetical protein [Mucilaginibacter auburnensis]PJJ80297.1 hypothetical protein CLV57_3447 [Mucilaginibacter auburnensis]